MGSIWPFFLLLLPLVFCFVFSFSCFAGFLFPTFLLSLHVVFFFLQISFPVLFSFSFAILIVQVPFFVVISFLQVSCLSPKQ